MSGQAAGLVLVAILGSVAAVETFRGWCEHRRDQRRAEDVLRRQGR